MNDKLSALLAQGIRELGLDFDDSQHSQLAAYLAELELFNPVYKLVGSEGEDLIIRHLLDSLAGAPVLAGLPDFSASTTIADLGSGAGLPGIPLAVALKQNSFILVERMGRRVDFLRNALVRTGLRQRVQVLERDLKEVKQQFDLITFRAFRPLAEILDEVAPILAEGGTVCAYKAQEDQVLQELLAVEKQCKSRWQARFVKLKVPFLDADRMLCILKKV
ncbi:MAG: 16S rRNA (guanine(527)-N(7))-methyltransferase RsmG [Sphaerochaeta sp.]|uniref:16S rRNA (guanine(527)-N(7))-methyltransferase RsmG n=1 Tax=Sphaerochaeta sp. TaxID=1972642 RepID=UPI002FC96C88